jgi:hypothetical protein
MIAKHGRFVIYDAAAVFTTWVELARHPELTLYGQVSSWATFSSGRSTKAGYAF